MTAFSIDCEPPWLVARFRGRRKILSWAVHRSGTRTAKRVAWLQVNNADLPAGFDPGDFLHARMRERGLDDAIGLMTSAPLRHHHHASVHRDGVWATCLMTFGLSNAERIGTRRSSRIFDDAKVPAVGTINALCHVSTPLSAAAMLEAMSIASQARTAAILSQPHEVLLGAGPVTGTGTDCIVMACPVDGAEQPYAGMHTAVGEALGAAVFQVTENAMRDWLDRNHWPPRGKPK